MEPVARTAFYCCALRAADAARPVPLCGDALASRFLDDSVRRDLAPLLRFPRPAASNVARHRLIDDLIRDSLAGDPTRRVILLGAGFDTRAFRLTGGRWWELDDRSLLVYKEARLPAGTAPNPLIRVPVDFQTAPLGSYLGPLAGRDRPVVVLEGVSMYLPQSVLGELAAGLRAHLPGASLICDLMSPAFMRWFSRGLRQELAKMGAEFAERSQHPREAIEAAGYRVEQVSSIIDRARRGGTMPIPAWLLNTLLRELRDGYAVWVFEPRN